MNIVILHGWKPKLDLSLKWYTPLVRHLIKKGHQVHAPDMPGFGGGKIPVNPYTVSDYAEWVYKYIVKENIVSPIIIGHSFGGRVAIRLLEKHPEVSQKLVLTGVPGYSPMPKNKIIFLKVLAKIGGLIFNLPLLKFFSASMRKLFYKFIGAWDYYSASGVMRETFKNIISDDLIESMKKLRSKTILIWGEQDAITPVWIGKKMNKIIKNSTLIIIPESTHSVLIDLPEKFISTIGTILEDR